MIPRIAGIFVITLLVYTFTMIGFGIHGEQQCRAAGYHFGVIGFPYPWETGCGKYTSDGIVYALLEE